MTTKGTTYRPVALMQYSPEETKRMMGLNALWVQTMDLKHDNILAYSLDIQVEDVSDVCQRKYVDMDDFYEYTDEHGKLWYISNSMSVQDMDEFFHTYFYEESIAA